MTELQMGLIGLGVAAVAGVFAYNKWQEHRHRKVAESVLKPQHDDVLLDAAPVAAKNTSAGEVRPVPASSGASAPEMPAERREPVFAAPEALAIPDENGPAETMPLAVEKPVIPNVQPVPEVPVMSAVPAQAAVPETEIGEAAALEDLPAEDIPAELLDSRIEFVVAMELVEAVSARQILHSQRDVLQRLHKPVHWFGYSERGREWVALEVDSELPVRRLRVGLQLVNRLGPIADADLALFIGAMQALADELMAVADMPPSRVRDQAAEIDRFCAAVDLEIGLNLVSRGSAFPGTKIRALAEAAGMVLGLDGLFTRYDDAGNPQFSLQNYENTPFSADSLRTLTTHGLTFLLDVPRVDHGERVFMQMTELARRFADTLQGVLVDDNRQPLSESQLDHIRREFIGKPQATMASYGLPAGSPQALRLFS